MELRRPPYPGPATLPGTALWPGLALGVEHQPAGWVQASDGRAAPYLAFMELEQARDTRRAVLDNLTGDTAFNLAAPRPEQPRWRVQFLVRTLDQVIYLSDMIASAADFTFTEWPGRPLSAVGETRILAVKATGRTAWYKLDLECVETHQ